MKAVVRDVDELKSLKMTSKMAFNCGASRFYFVKDSENFWCKQVQNRFENFGTSGAGGTGAQHAEGRRAGDGSLDLSYSIVLRVFLAGDGCLDLTGSFLETLKNVLFLYTKM